MSRLMKLILIFFLILIGLVFHLRNSQQVVLDYLIGSQEFYLSIWMFASLVSGTLLGIFASLPIIFKLKRDNIRLSNQVNESEKEIKNLRVLPVKDNP